ncbi:MAG: PIG-L family deacetylase, partial [Clostridia bacterium]|nr:PIG-L family deacetylase [Clostridia bacterium]
NWEDSEGFTPYMYFDVSDVFEDWKAAVRQLYLTEHSRDFKYLQFYEGLARMRGALNKCEYATAFDIDGYMKRTRGEV